MRPTNGAVALALPRLACQHPRGSFHSVRPLADAPRSLPRLHRVVALGEIGDKTQLLALMLAARFRRPLPIVCGILVATLANHYARRPASAPGCARVVPEEYLRWLLAASFFARRALGAEARPAGRRPGRRPGRLGVFAITVDRVLPRRDGRQDADRDRDAGCAVPFAPRGRRRNDARHADRRRARRVPGASRRGADPAPPGSRGTLPRSSSCWPVFALFAR